MLMAKNVLKLESLPSALQFRFAGYKGVISWDKALDTKGIKTRKKIVLMSS